MDAALIIMRMGGDAVLSRTNPYRCATGQFGDITLGSKNVLSLLARRRCWRKKRPTITSGRCIAAPGRKSLPRVSTCTLTGANLTTCTPPSLNARAHPDQARTWFLAPAPSLSGGLPYSSVIPGRACSQCGRLCHYPESVFRRAFCDSCARQAAADGTQLDPWRGESLILGGEIDKLAVNIALARNAAGVHFRSDSIRGLELGQDVALGADTTLTYSEKFDGFALRRFDGAPVRIRNGSVETLRS